MRLFVLCVLVAAVVAATAEPARACSCALGDPRTALSRADAAFVGVFVERRDETTFVFRVEERVKGPLGATVAVRSASSGAACGLEVQPGNRIGLFLDRADGEWRGSLCGQVEPRRLREAARPLPAPDGSGPVALLVGGRYGPARTIALDRRGRTLAYGRGRDEVYWLSVCPGSRRVVEYVVGSRHALAIRELPSLRLLRLRTLPFPRTSSFVALRCADRGATDVAVFSADLNRNGRGALLLRLAKGRLRTIWSGTALAATLGPTHAVVTAGERATRALRVDLATGRARVVTGVPAFTGPLASSPDGVRLAGLAGRRIVLVERGRARSARVLPSSGGDLFWLGRDRLAYFPRYAGDRIRIFDTSLRLRGRIGGWAVAATTLVGSTAFGVDYDGRLLAARLPGGPVRVVRRLPGPVTNVLAAAPR